MIEGATPFPVLSKDVIGVRYLAMPHMRLGPKLVSMRSTQILDSILWDHWLSIEKIIFTIT